MKWFALTLLTFIFQLSTSLAQGTAFTYQGRLAANGLPYTGLAEMQFALFSMPSGSSAIAVNTPAVVSVNVNAGLFTLSLDFGTSVFRGEDRWLEIQVRTNLGAFSTLSPRQPLTAVPYALFAQTAGAVTNDSINAAHIASGQVVKSLNGLKDGVNLVAGGGVTLATNGNDLSVSSPWLLNGSDTFYNSGNAGIGTPAPIAGMHVKKEPLPPGGTLALEGDTHTYMTFYPDGVAAGRKGFFGFASSDTTNLTIANEYPGGSIVLFDHSGVLFPSAGEENLRIVRGEVDALGNRLSGSGFSSERTAAGVYAITYNAQFAGRPSVTATVYYSGARRFAMVSSESDAAVIHVHESESGAAVNESFYFIAIGPR